MKILAKIGYWLYVKSQPKKKWIEGCEIVFNRNGHNYHKYKDSGALPTKRLERLQALVMMLNNRLDRKEFDTLTEIIERYVQSAIESLETKGRLSGLQNAVFAVQELRSRKEDLMFHPSIMMEIAAVYLIRDDENPYEINELIINEKKELFLKEADHISFFLQAGIESFLPNTNELLNASEQQLKAFMEQYKITDELIKKKLSTYESILGKQKSELMNIM